MKATEVEREITDGEYCDVLDDIFGTVEICGMTFNSGYALKKLDPTAFRCGKVDYEDTLERRWQCSECEGEYNDEEEAEQCCQLES